MAELHIVGQLVGASGFDGHSIFCKWGVHAGRSWELVEGLDGGQTQADRAPDGDIAVWGHPLDVHYVCRGLSGWPKLHVQIWAQDVHGRNELKGYGFCHVPTSPGVFELDCPTWLPEGSALERVTAFFVGGAPRLRAEEVVHSPGDRFRLQTAAAGVVHVRLGVIMREFERNGVATG
ncbi:MAG: B9 domain-containing protein [Monoraphidium minutum]|nr:MAG: B9 domain-containing protein [Monoraphidium minutum]